jgi:hypothetical protein
VKTQRNHIQTTKSLEVRKTNLTQEINYKDINFQEIYRKILIERFKIHTYRILIKMVISLVKLSFLFYSEITVFHRYLYNKKES